MTRHIQVFPRIEEINKLEHFIEEVCDEYCVYDAYYGNILASLTILFELNSKENEASRAIDIYCHKTKDRLYFSVLLYSHFLDIARIIEATDGFDLATTNHIEKELRDIMMIRMLTDEVKILPKEEALRLTFYVSGINDLLTLQRIELLEKYYDKIFQLQKTS